MEDLKISNMSQYLEIVEELQESYPNGPLANSPAATTLIFRGVSDEAYPLLPSVFRGDIEQFESRKITNGKYTTENLREALEKQVQPTNI